LHDPIRIASGGPGFLRGRIKAVCSCGTRATGA